MSNSILPSQEVPLSGCSELTWQQPSAARPVLCAALLLRQVEQLRALAFAVRARRLPASPSLQRPLEWRVPLVAAVPVLPALGDQLLLLLCVLLLVVNVLLRRDERPRQPTQPAQRVQSLAA